MSNPSLARTVCRRAVLGDINDIAEVLTLCFNQFNKFTFWIYPLVKMAVAQDLRQRLQQEDADYFCLVAVYKQRESEEIVGTVELSFRRGFPWLKPNRYAYVANLAVKEKYRRRGIATCLLLKCEEIAKANNYGCIYLHVLASNQGAQKLYLGNGYTIHRVETDLLSLFVPGKRRLLLMKTL
ncbi:MAG TPA: GNAT family N-acetyltransferase [Geminocystis sp. M7585_C2015_104]|nr:GNAT family N-acetyltransferase [Geminocystis sp. M7585_C2015_104]